MLSTSIKILSAIAELGPSASVQLPPHSGKSHQLQNAPHPSPANAKSDNQEPANNSTRVITSNRKSARAILCNARAASWILSFRRQPESRRLENNSELRWWARTTLLESLCLDLALAMWLRVSIKKGAKFAAGGEHLPLVPIVFAQDFSKTSTYSRLLGWHEFR